MAKMRSPFHNGLFLGTTKKALLDNLHVAQTYIANS